MYDAPEEEILPGTTVAPSVLRKQFQQDLVKREYLCVRVSQSVFRVTVTPGLKDLLQSWSNFQGKCSFPIAPNLNLSPSQ